MGKSLLCEHRQPVTLAHRNAGASPFAHAIGSENGGIFKWRGKIRASGVRDVVLRKIKLSGFHSGLVENAFDRRCRPRFFLYPRWYRHRESLEAEWCRCAEGAQESREFADRLVVEGDGIDLPAGTNTGSF